MTPTDRAKARALCDVDAAVLERGKPIPSDYRNVTDAEMEAYNAWWDRNQRFADPARTLLPAALSDLDRLAESRDDAMRLHRAAVVQRENLRRILQETVGAFVLHGYDVARILGIELAAEVELEAEHDGTAPKGGDR
jgi:hypothetical protein